MRTDLKAEPAWALAFSRINNFSYYGNLTVNMKGEKVNGTNFRYSFSCLRTLYDFVEQEMKRDRPEPKGPFLFLAIDTPSIMKEVNAMNIIFKLLIGFVCILAILGMVLGVTLYGVGELLGGTIWIILGIAIGIAICKKKGS